MASIFTKIINGQLPGRIVYKDERAFAILSIKPLKPGHTLVVPRDEVAHWIDLKPEVLAHLGQVSQMLGKAIQAAFRPAKVGLMAVGLEVQHVHFHLVPINAMGDLDFGKQDENPDPSDLDAAAQRIKAALAAMK